MPSPDSLPGLPADYTVKFFMDDVVTIPDQPDFRGKVLRCWADEDGGPIPHLSEGQEAHPLDRLLRRGEVGISNMTTNDLSIVPESSLTLYQREFLKGDIVKRSLSKPESGVVYQSNTEVRIQHVLSGDVLEQWIPFGKLGNSLFVEATDRVIYDQWIGTVQEVFEDALVESQVGLCYRLAEMGGSLEPGRTATDAVPKDVAEMQLSTPLPPFANLAVDKIIAVRPVIVYITWNAINQQLPIAEQEKHPQPPTFWYGPELKKLTHFDGSQSQPPLVGSSIRFTSEADEKAYGVKPSMHVGGTLPVRVFRVIESRSKVLVRWQTGKETEESAVDLVPYRDIDDYESWPGDHIIWRGDDGERRPAIVQNFDPHQRVAEVLFSDTKEQQTVPVLELDPGGRESNTHYGIGVGQSVLLCDDNGSTPPQVPILGQHETPVDNMWWRNELSKLAQEYVDVKNSAKFAEHLPEGDKTQIDWYGEITHLNLDGTINVLLANGETRRVELQNVYLLNEPHAPDMFDDLGPLGPAGIFDPEDGDAVMFDNGAFDNSMPGYIPMAMEMRVSTAMGTDGHSEASWETMDFENEDESVDERQVELLVPTAEQATSPIIPLVPIPITTDIVAECEAGPSIISNGRVRSPSTPLRPIGDDREEDEEGWRRFEMLEEAPDDHHFIGEPRLDATNKQYHSRLQKEHRALMSSLPENILVRTYENRTDLMRALIIGPDETPYANAPFIFDIYLNPTKFPHEPPLVHFHSHTNGHGRCNPNLYEDGKVCLSILGTWSGDQSESWNPSKSSLLQVFVSISGLVLVRSPYHCEPAFAKLEGTREGKINSRLYSEKAYVLSRSFIRTALERPPSDFLDELNYFYLTRGKLRKVIDHSQRLIDKHADLNTKPEEDENVEIWNQDAMGNLTMGAAITLKRILVSLEGIWEERTMINGTSV